MVRKADFARVRKVGLTIPGLEEGKVWNGPCLKASGKIAACMATHKSAEPGTLVVVVGEDVRELLVMAARYRSAEDAAKPARTRRR